MSDIKNITVVGTGVIGGGWVARFLAHGYKVIATDPAPNAEEKLRAIIDNAWPALEKVGISTGASKDNLTFEADLVTAVKDADFVQEAVPEVIEIKKKVFATIDANTKADTIIASSTSGLLPTEMQGHLSHPERLTVGHPFNPVYLLPLVEICGGNQTSDDIKQRQKAFYESINMAVIMVKKEIDGFVADRLLEAIWRENLHLINDDVADTADCDDAIRMAAGLRWAIMGTNQTYHLAGGDAGMHHFMKQFGPALKLPWTKLEAPELTDELINKVADGTQRQAEGKTVKELEQLRDNCLIEIMAVLKKYNFGAGKFYPGEPAK